MSGVTSQLESDQAALWVRLTEGSMTIPEFLGWAKGRARPLAAAKLLIDDRIVILVKASGKPTCLCLVVDSPVV